MSLSQFAGQWLEMCEDMFKCFFFYVRVNAEGSLFSYLAFKAQVRLQAKLARWVTAHTTRNGALGPH